ncbi:MAG TPA: aminotransferase class IV [Thermoanaerobaculia bacterium]|nr:aminotransferase class IV [Thermoanaerobaculia bacterium]
MMTDTLYINGRFTTTGEKVIGIEDRGLQFGDGVYEAIKFLRRRLIFGADHHRRMEQGLREIDIPSPWSQDEFDAVMSQLLQRTSFDVGFVYVQVTRGECERVHFYPDGLQPTVIAYSRRFQFPDAAKKAAGIRIITTEDTRWKYCDVKSTNLLGNVLAKKRAQRAGAEEALFIDRGVVTEGASSSFFAVSQERLITHPVDHGILPGTVRDRVITLALSERIRVDERPLRDDELYSLDEAFITSTTQGVMPVCEIDDRAVGNGRRGEITQRFQRLFDELEATEAAGGHFM